MIIALKIDVSKIDKAKLYNGTKGTYLDAVVFVNDEADKYGNNGMITQSVTKEEREKGVKGAILGNCKIIGGGNATAKAKQQEEPIAANQEEDDLPF